MTPFDHNDQPKAGREGDGPAQSYQPPRIERLTAQDLEVEDQRLVCGESPLGEEDSYY